MNAITTKHTVGVVGAGTMGAGIAQLAAAAGHSVLLYDRCDGAAKKGKIQIGKGLEKLIFRGKMTKETCDVLLDRIDIASDLAQFKDAALVVEAIIENLEIKQGLFSQLEEIVASDTILGTNTSSISVTSIARTLKKPERVVGMHFFNPAPIMKLVEVVSGISTSPDVAQKVFETAKAWGKIPVHAKSTPGFIVNRVARPFYAEALRLSEEQLADPSTIDALLTEGVGFRMGPFALMDLIGNDVNYTVCKSVFDAYYQEPRFRPSILQLEMVNAGRLGRKSGQGFYSYTEDAVAPAPATYAVTEAEIIDGFAIGTDFMVDGVDIKLTDGRTAEQVANGLSRPVIIYDLIDLSTGSRVAFTTSKDVPNSVVDRFVGTLAAKKIAAVNLADWPGLVTMRTVAALANEAFEAVMQGVSDNAGVDEAMRYGVNYPKGPIAWAREIGLDRVLKVLDSIYALTGDPRYRASMALRMASNT